MPNWCYTAYAIEGDAEEVKSLYETMKGLENREEPLVQNGFGTTWLGCLVDALGGDWHGVRCRGNWENLEMQGETLYLTTMTAWCPCNETFDLVCEKYPSLRYYYRTEEPGMAIYETNDSEGVYFSEKYHVELHTPDDDFYSEYFTELSDIFEWLEDLFDQPVTSREDFEALVAKWCETCAGAYGVINEFQIV